MADLPSLSPSNSKNIISKSNSPSPFIGASSENSENSPTSSPSPIAIPTSAGTLENCYDCEFGSSQQVIDSSNNGNTNGSDDNGTSEVNLVTDNGDDIGTLIIPNDAAGPDESFVIDVSFVTNIPQSQLTVPLGSTILDITITNSFGITVTELDEPVEICLTADDVDTDDSCLSFFNTDTGQWECEDPCLKQEGNQYCGSTDHLTSFALLLDGGGNGNNGNDPCDSDSTDYTLAWISLGLVAGAICCIILAIIALELRFRKKEYTQRRSFKTMASNVSRHMH